MISLFITDKLSSEEDSKLFEKATRLSSRCVRIQKDSALMKW